jgi:SNF2 family DNA or RNA helicase
MALQDLIEELSGKRLLVFYQFQHDRDRILNLFPSATVFSGGTTAKDAARIVKNWNAGKIPLLLTHQKAAGHGVNLQESDCCDVAFFGVGDSPDEFEQAYRRVYRQGVQGTQVRVHRILAADTLDEVIVRRLDGKLDTQQKFFEAVRRHAEG